MKNSLDYRRRSRIVIPGGNSLLSKRPELFSPSKWPGYFTKAKGIRVTDLDKKTYIDFSHFSVGTCTLGYNNNKINKEVKKAISRGNISTFNSYEEVQLAEKLIEMHPWAGMARFARSGGEANAIAVRIARAARNKEKILFCGYHGWHDWYLSANLRGVNTLNDHLLPGLDPLGVPQSLQNTTETFFYGDLAKVESELATGDYAALKMEVMKNVRPENEYLKNIRDICDKHNVILIFDECTSGFREAFGGMHLNYDVRPDLCVLGKALGNGFPITCVLGTEQVMQDGSASFISSTFWTERLGFVAALATLKEMEKLESWNYITDIGKLYKSELTEVFKELEIPFNWSGMPALLFYEISNCQWLHIKTWITERFLDFGYLSGASFYPSTQHKPKDVKKFAMVFKTILEELLSIGFEEVAKEMEGRVCHSTFKRLN